MRTVCTGSLLLFTQKPLAASGLLISRLSLITQATTPNAMQAIKKIYQCEIIIEFKVGGCVMVIMYGFFGFHLWLGTRMSRVKTAVKNKVCPHNKILAHQTLDIHAK